MRLRAFGGLTIESAAQELGGAAGQRRPLALLLLLATGGERGFSRDKLLALLWPESDEERARAALRQTLHSLRRDLHAPELFLGATELKLNSAVLSSDLADFDGAVARGDAEARRHAIELYTGPLADGFLLGKAPEFERWLDGERQTRARRFAEACEALARDAAQRGDHRSAVAFWEKLAAQDRLSSRVALALMQALVAAGDRAAAVRHARIHEAVVRAELDVAPDPAVPALARQLQSEALVASPSPPRRVAEPVAPLAVGAGRAALSPGATVDSAVEIDRLRGLHRASSEPARATAAPAEAEVDVDVPTSDERNGAPVVGAAEPASTVRTVLDRSPPASPVPAGPGAWRSSRVRAAVYVAAGILAVGVAARQAMVRAAPARQLDTSLYLVLPFRAEGDTARIGLSGDQVERELYEAISRWEDVRPVDALRVEDMLARRGAPRHLGDALDAARSFNAGYLIWGELSRFRDTIVVQAALYDVAKQQSARAEVVHVPSVLLDIQARFRQLADSLLMGGTRAPPGMHVGDRRPTRLAAWRAYHRGYTALEQWRLADAAKELRAATTIDPDFAQAWFWLAQVTNWLGDERSERDHRAARRAVELQARLSPRDRVAAAALAALAEGQYPQACTRYRELLARDSLDFAAWYGLGECQARDSAVVADGRSASGRSFRASYHGAIGAYARALDLVPSFHLAFRDRAYARLASLLFATPGRVRYGVEVTRGDTIVLAAWPAWERDTLAFVPYPIEAFREGRPGTNPPTRARALAHTRAQLRRITETWLVSFSTSVDAMEAHALALEAAGEVTTVAGREGALSLVRRARTLVPAEATAQRLRLAAAEVHLLAKADSLARARAVADSILAAWTSPPAPHDTVLAGVAALGGRASRAATLLAYGAPSHTATTPRGQPIAVPPSINAAVLRLTVFAAFGGPRDSLRAVESRVERLIGAHIEPQRQPAARSALLYLPLRFAYTELAARAALPPDVAADPLIEMHLAVERGDHAFVRRQLDAVRLRRSSLAAGDIAPDALFQEILLSLRIGDTASAVGALDRMLEALPTNVSATGIRHPFGAAAIVRAMALRAELAVAARDMPTARRWSQAVVTLWSGADPYLQPVVARMRHIGRPTPTR